MKKLPMSHSQAEVIYNILIQTVGASPSEVQKRMFIDLQTSEYVPEYRLNSELGYGGKLIRESGFVPSGSAHIFVNYYSEDTTDKRNVMVFKANNLLKDMK
jgi:hypothetical protein